jgi:hypothetical protein
MNDENDIPLETLADKENMSVRAVNTCRKLKLDTLHKILRFYDDGSDFKDAPGAGRKVDEEMIGLCERYKDREHIAFFKIDSDRSKFLEGIRSMQPDKRDTLYRYMENELQNLAPRARHSLELRFGKDPAPSEMLEVFFSERFEPRQLPNIGEITEGQLYNYIGRIKGFADHLAGMDQDGLTSMHAKEVVAGLQNKASSDIEKLMSSVVDPHGRILIFRLIDRLIRSDFVFGKKENKKWVFLLHYTDMDEVEKGEVKSLLDVGSEMARQINRRLSESMHHHFGFIKDFRPQDLCDFGYRPDAAFLRIDGDFVNKVQSADGTRFNIHFLSRFMTMMAEDTHHLLGTPRAWNSRRFLSEAVHCKNVWMVRKDIWKEFDFKGFLTKMRETTSGKVERDMAVGLSDLLPKFKKRGSDVLKDEVVGLCRAILEEECGLLTDADGKIIVKRNTKRLELLDFVVEALEALGEPSKATRIVEHINNSNPYVATNVQSVKSKIRRNGELFIYFGRSSTFGLRRWEEEKENVRGGTIRDIAEDYLKKQTEPKHISEITKHVQCFRGTNQSSVRHNLEVDQRKRFRHFPGGFVGLSDKLYTDTDRYKKIPGQLFRSSVLKKWDGRMVEDLIRHFIDKYGCEDVQVRSIIEYKVAKGELSLTPEGKLAVH